MNNSELELFFYEKLIECNGKVNYPQEKRDIAYAMCISELVRRKAPIEMIERMTKFYLQQSK